MWSYLQTFIQSCFLKKSDPAGTCLISTAAADDGRLDRYLESSACEGIRRPPEPVAENREGTVRWGGVEWDGSRWKAKSQSKNKIFLRPLVFRIFLATCSKSRFSVLDQKSVFWLLE